LAVQKLFDVRAPAELTAVPDVPLGSAVAGAAQAISPYLNGNLLCPGCALTANFMPDLEATRGVVTVVLVSVLVAQRRIELLGQSESDQLLATVQDAGRLSRPARAYFATAIKNGLLELKSGDKIDSSGLTTRADLALQLDRTQQNLGISHK
jgi:hypothetical protein